MLYRSDRNLDCHVQKDMKVTRHMQEILGVRSERRLIRRGGLRQQDGPEASISA